MSGVPSIGITLARREDILASTLAVGRAALPRARNATVLFLAGGLAHVAISLGWGVVLAGVLPRRRAVLAGAVAGLGIAALDLGMVGRRLPTIRALDQGPQVLDHIAYGVVVGAVLSRLRRESRAAYGGAQSRAASASSARHRPLSRRRSAQQTDGRGGAGSRS